LLETELRSFSVRRKNFIENPDHPEKTKEDNVMKRRIFIRSAALGGAAASVFPAGCKPQKKVSDREQISPEPFALEEMTIGEMQKKMGEGSLTAEKVVLLRIAYAFEQPAGRRSRPQFRSALL